jgi:hypothetical protein
MKKYLKDLEEELRKNNLSEKEIEEILADHQEMIDTAKKEGLSEDELNEKFGDPKDVAEELSDFSEQATDKEKKVKKAATKELIFDGVKENYNFTIGLINEDIEIEPIEGDKIIVKAIGNINFDKYEIGFENNEFELKAPKGLRRNYFGFDSEKRFIIHLPKGIRMNEAKMKLINGDVRIENIDSEKFELGTNNGDLDLKKLNTKTFVLGGINGDVLIEDFKSNTLKISTISGDLKIDRLVVKEDVFVNTVSGNVIIDNSECAEMKLKTVSGDICGKEFYPGQVSMNSVSGDINVVNTDKTKPVEIITKRSVSGDVKFVLKQKR